MESTTAGDGTRVVREPIELSEAVARPAGEAGIDDWRRMFAKLASGEEGALETLYRATARRIFGLALWRTGSVEDACDVVQEVFVRVATETRRLGKVTDPRGWLLGVAHHVAIDTVRGKRRRAAEPIEDTPFLVTPEQDTAREVDARHAAQLLALLPPAQREAIYLKHYADCTFAEIGRITAVPTFTAASRYRLGLGRLRRLLEGTS